MAKHIACLTFDFDAMSLMIARGMTTPTPISRGEFGAIAVPRILALLARHGIRSSWFVPGTVVRTYPDLCRRIVAEGHEIGNHGWTHVPPAALNAAEEEAELLRANEAIAEITGAPPRGYRSPSWDLSEATLPLLIKHGFDYDSSMMGHDHSPYFARIGDVIEDKEPMRFGTSTKLVEMPVSWSLDDFPHFEYFRAPTSLAPGLKSGSAVLENFVADFEYMRRTEDWGALTYTFHPFVVGRGHRMLMLEALIEALKDKGAVFETLAEVAAAFRAGQPRPAG